MQSFIDKSVGEWRRRLECASLLYVIRQMAPLYFPKLI